MLKKISQKLNLSDSIQEFLKSSSIVFFANILGAILGYILVIIVSRELENISLWTALNSFVMIVGILINGLATDVAKRSAELLEKGVEESYSYLITLKRGVKKMIPFFLILSPLFAFGIQKILGTDFMIAFIILLNIPAQVFSNMNNHFLMGVFSHKDFAKNSIVINIVRFVTTIGFLFLGFEIYALVLGIVASVVFGWIHNHFLVQKFLKKSTQLSEISPNENYSLASEIKGISSTVIANTSIQLPLLIFPILAVAFLSAKNADVFAIFFTIGQIINFGVTSFLTLIIPFAAGRKDQKIFWLSLFFTAFGGICGVLFFVYFRETAFSVFSRPEYSQYVTEMTLYFSAVALFNILFFVGRYMIGKGEQKKLFPLLGILGIGISGLFILGGTELELQKFLVFVLGLVVVMVGYLGGVKKFWK